MQVMRISHLNNVCMCKTSSVWWHISLRRFDRQIFRRNPPSKIKLSHKTPVASLPLSRKRCTHYRQFSSQCLLVLNHLATCLPFYAAFPKAVLSRMLHEPRPGTAKGLRKGAAPSEKRAAPPHRAAVVLGGILRKVGWVRADLADAQGLDQSHPAAPSCFWPTLLPCPRSSAFQASRWNRERGTKRQGPLARTTPSRRRPVLTA